MAKKQKKISPENFVFWLQGFIEMENPKSLNIRQTKIIKDHLKMVFVKETPDRNRIKELAESIKIPEVKRNEKFIDIAQPTLYC